MVMVPYKSVAAALVLTVLFGPLGLFYSSFLGGVVMSIFGLVGVGTMASMRSPFPMATVWLFSLIWSMAAVRLYNRKMLKIAVTGCLHETKKEKEFNMFSRKKQKSQEKSSSHEEPVSNEEATASWKL